MKLILSICFFSFLIWSCQNTNSNKQDKVQNEKEIFDAQKAVAQYKSVRLTTDLENLTENQKKMLPYLIQAAQIMDTLFWYQSYGDHFNETLKTISNEDLKQFFKINYGPWDRLNNFKPFIENTEEKPLGSTFYPNDLTKEELNNSKLKEKKDMYSVIRRSDTGLYAIPYHQLYKDELQRASQLLLKAAQYADNNSFKKYLELRAQALLTDDFTQSDLAWMDIQNNTLDIIIGPIEHYEDRLFNYRTAYEAYVLVKDTEWSKRLEKYVAYLPELQKNLPVDEKYKQEKPGLDAQLNAYDVIYYAGDCNAGSKTIAVNLPNDEKIQQEKGTKRSQLKNAMKAKFDHILLPISEMLIDKKLQKHITFNAFFANTMFHEVAHGLGIKNTINGKSTVREALQESFSPLEEGKADILGLYMVTQLKNKGVLEEGELMDYYVTFLAGIFRSVRFGAGSAHGQANILRFNYFKEANAFQRQDDGTYTLNFDNFQKAVNDLSALILKLQGDGDKEGVDNLMAEKGKVGKTLQADLDKLSQASIPVDIIFEQGLKTLGLN